MKHISIHTLYIEALSKFCRYASFIFNPWALSLVKVSNFMFPIQ